MTDPGSPIAPEDFEATSNDLGPLPARITGRSFDFNEAGRSTEHQAGGFTLARAKEQAEETSCD